jgi:hypothetical protein
MEEQQQAQTNTLVEPEQNAQEESDEAAISLVIDKQLQAYRNTLVEAECKAQENFDKTVISLSGGALGISFAFVKDIIFGKPADTGYLLASWVVWGLSVSTSPI